MSLERYSKILTKPSISEEEMDRIETFLYQEEPFKIDISVNHGMKGKICMNLNLLHLLRKRGEDLDNLRVSRYADKDMFIELKAEGDTSLELHQLKLHFDDMIELNYGESVWEVEHLRLILGENNKVFKDLLLTNNNMYRAREVLDKGYLKYSGLSKEDKVKLVHEIDKYLTPVINAICRVYPKLRGDIREVAYGFIHEAAFLLDDVRNDLPPGINNVRVYKGLKENEVAIHKFFLIDYPCKRAEVCIVHPLLRKNFFEIMYLKPRMSLKLYETGFSPLFLENRGIPVPRNGRMRLEHAIEYLDKEINPEDISFSV